MRTECKKKEMTNDELLVALCEAHEEILGLHAQIAEARWIEEELRKRTRELSERVKELDCLYSISDVLRNRELNLEQVLKEIVNILPRAYQYPARTRTRLTVAGQVFCSKGFCENVCCQSVDIQVQRSKIGIIEVVVSPHPSFTSEPTYLPEEELLLNVVAVWIGEIIEHRQRKR